MAMLFLTGKKDLTDSIPDDIACASKPGTWRLKHFRLVLSVVRRAAGPGWHIIISFQPFLIEQCCCTNPAQLRTQCPRAKCLSTGGNDKCARTLPVYVEDDRNSE